MALEPLVPPDTVRVATRIAARTILASQQCTRMPQNGAKRPFSPICVHSCAPTSVHNGATVYTNGPKQLQETILANLCTLLCPRGQADPAGARTRAAGDKTGLARPGGVTGPTTSTAPRPPTTQAHNPTVYTNAPKRHREAISTDLCTLLRRRPGGEAHVAGVVTQPPTHTSSRSRQTCRISRVPPRFTPTALDHDQLLPRPLRQTSRLGMRPSNSRSHPDCRLAPSALAPCVPQSALRLASSLSVEVAPCQN